MRARIMGPLCFSDRIECVRELLNAINRHIEDQNVEIIDVRTKGSEVRLARL